MRENISNILEITFNKKAQVHTMQDFIFVMFNTRRAQSMVLEVRR